MADEPYKDPEKLAWAIHTSENYAEAAEKLDCSTGTISVWKSKLSDELEQYSSSDFDNGEVVEQSELTEQEVEQRVLNLLQSFDYTRNGNLVRVSGYGLAIELSGSIDGVAGKDLNPFIAVSEHKYGDELVRRARENDVGIIVGTDDGVEIRRDSTVTVGSGLRAVLKPDEATTTDKYTSRAWLENQIEAGRSPIDIAEECEVLTRTVNSFLEEYGI